ncbi:MAG: hypothetical protein FJZ16_03800 [Candidatus Omnitrophica bacterium]|nr:hypothetical protein [Candidatus Omnitrophota bacterium]
MRIIADFHIHSKYSRATSKDMDIENLSKYAKLKGINLLGTGDFTYPLWLIELKEKLTQKGYGLFEYDGVNFILTVEVSNMFSKSGKSKRVHNIIFVPTFEVADKINSRLERYGNLMADGRPMLGLSCAELVRIIFDINENCIVVPAHCLFPDTLIHTKDGLKRIKDVLKGDLVYTHKLNYKRVTQRLKRAYNGKIYHIRPYYFREGLRTTPEHPFYIIKTYKQCRWIGGICRPSCSKINKCKRRYFKDYQPQWIQAKDIAQGDVILFPRFKNKIKDVETLKISDFLKKEEYVLANDKIYPQGYRVNRLENVIKIDKDFCRLSGYFISEGYTNGRDCLSFSFNSRELDYIKDVKQLMKDIFNISLSNMQVKKGVNGVELIFYSKILLKLFSKLFYANNLNKRAYSKRLPNWMLKLPFEKQVEILKGWWRGDTGYTSSRILMNQMKIILLRLGIIPSIRIDSKEAYKRRGKHKIGKREIDIQHDNFQFSNLSIFQNNHGLLEDDCFKEFKTKSKRKHGWIDERYIYIPIRDIEVMKYKGEVYNLEVEENNSYVAEFAIIHNCWTPWFALFGSMSGFDKIEDCFEEQTPKIYALETGLSSDPAMNWRLSQLDKYTLISNSDSHSPSKIGREANAFDAEMDYLEILDILKKKDKRQFLYTVEFFPEEGKYHYDGHRLCNVRFSPQETKKNKGLCPVCRKPVTVGVMNRVDELADREIGFVPQNSIPFKNMIPLEEIIAQVRGKSPDSQVVQTEYKSILQRLGNEFEVLLDIKEERLLNSLPIQIARAIINVRRGNVNILPGYDGVYGKIELPQEDDKQEKQLTLF